MQPTYILLLDLLGGGRFSGHLASHTYIHTEGALEPPLNTFCISKGKLLREDELLMLLPKLMRMRDQRPTNRRRSHIHCSTAELQIALIVRLSSVQFGLVAICRLLGQAAAAAVDIGATRSAPALASASASALGSINPQGIDSTHVGVCCFCWTLVALSFAPG